MLNHYLGDHIKKTQAYEKTLLYREKNYAYERNQRIKKNNEQHIWTTQSYFPPGAPPEVQFKITSLISTIWKYSLSISHRIFLRGPNLTLLVQFVLTSCVCVYAWVCVWRRVCVFVCACVRARVRKYVYQHIRAHVQLRHITQARTHAQQIFAHLLIRSSCISAGLWAPFDEHLLP